jgi:hypothetical protein
VLTTKLLEHLPKFDGLKVIYGEANRINRENLEKNQIKFKQIPYDIIRIG